MEVINVVVSHVTAHFVMIEPALKYRFSQLSDLEQESERKQSFYVERKALKYKFTEHNNVLHYEEIRHVTD